MATTKYQKGADFERRIVKYLIEIGYYAMRSAGSKGLFDIIAIPKRDVLPGIPLLIQAKRHGAITTEELANLRNSDWVGMTLICHHKRRSTHLLFTNMLGENVELEREV